jgi:hypothetical protein
MKSVYKPTNKTTKPKKPSTKQKPMPILKDKEVLQNTVAEAKAFQSLFEKCIGKK